ncbi:MAG: hypothetical protein AB7K86_16560 [Rhodospirillales bacterium]
MRSNSSTLERAVRLLVTGFSAFPGVPDNPTERLVGALADDDWRPAAAAQAQHLVLKTEYGAAAQALDAALVAFDPDAVVSFGVHGGADSLRVECVARNRVSQARADNAGTIPAGAIDDGPPAMAGSFDAVRVCEAVRARGVPVRLSHDAGTYLCNFAYYRALRWGAGRGRSVGFIHVPPLAVVGLPALREATEAAVAAALEGHAAANARRSA